MRRLAIVLTVSLAGCISYCKGGPILVKASQGDLVAMDEAGNLGRPRVPSTAEALPLMRDAFEAVKPLLASPRELVRVEAVEALRHLAERAPDVWRNSYADLFEVPLADTSREVRWRAAWAMSRLGASSPGLRAAAQDADDDVALTSLEGLGKAFDEQGLPALERALDRSDPVRKAAVSALEKLAGRPLPDTPACRAFLAERKAAAGARGSKPDTAPVGS